MVFHLPRGRCSLISCNKSALILCQGVSYVEKKTCVECWYQSNLILLKRQLRNPVYSIYHNSCIWWRHQMEAFSALLALCVGNSHVSGEFPTQRPVTRSFDDLCLNKRLSKQSWGWWFETPSRPLWRHWNDMQLWQAGLKHSQPQSPAWEHRPEMVIFMLMLSYIGFHQTRMVAYHWTHGCIDVLGNSLDCP